MQKIIRLPEVMSKTGRSRSSIYADIKDEVFPAPISIGLRAVGWVDSEINAWIEAKITASRQN
jgi:prophage regulatory protein